LGNRLAGVVEAPLGNAIAFPVVCGDGLIGGVVVNGAGAICVESARPD
jgi:hypothetical protein